MGRNHSNLTPLIFLLLVANAAAGSGPRPELAEFAPLAGCWRLERDNEVVDEWWMPPAGDALLGMARTVRDGRLRNHEWTRIARQPDGSIAYEAHPSGQPAAVFPLVRWEGRKAVFEDPSHDFPQRVIYDLSRPDRLDARVEGTHEGKMRGFDYPYRRVPCLSDNGGLPPPVPTP